MLSPNIKVKPSFIVFGLIGLLILIAGDIWFVGRACEYEASYTKIKPEQCQHSYPLASRPVVGFVVNFPSDFWHWLHDSHEEILGLFTIGICIVTGLLAWYTKGLFNATVALSREAEKSSRKQRKEMRQSLRIARAAAEAATLQAAAAVGVELPILSADYVEFMSLTAPIPKKGPYSCNECTKIPKKYSGISDFTFRNQGRSPAFLTKLSVGHVVAPAPVGEPSYLFEIKLPHGEIIRANGGEKRIDFGVTIECSDSDIAAMETGNSHLWVYGQLTYTDFLDETINHYRFCWRYINVNEGQGPGSELYFLESVDNAPANYVKNKKEKKWGINTGLSP